MNEQSLYSVLEVSPKASQSVISAAYKALAMKCHPDRNDGDPKAELMMSKINQAYGVLSDPIKRKLYDDGKMSNENHVDDGTHSPQGTPNAQLIIQFKSRKIEYENLVHKYLVTGDYTPDDMLHLSKFSKSELIYVPAYIFVIEYEANWTASFGYDRDEHYTVYETKSLGRDKDGNSLGSHKVPVTKVRTVTDWRPASGVDSGAFSVNTYAGNKLVGNRLAQLVVRSIILGEIEDFNSSFLDGLETDDFSVSAPIAYEALEDEVKVNIDQRVERHGQGDHQKNWRWNSKTSHSTKTIYVPIYHAVIDYNDVEYNVWLDGINSYNGLNELGIVADKLPEDTSRKDLVETIRLRLVPNIKNYLVPLGFVPLGIGVSCIVLAICFTRFTFDNLGGGVAATAWLGGGYAAARRYYLLRYSNYLIEYSKGIIESSQRARASLLKKIQMSSNVKSEVVTEAEGNIPVPSQEHGGSGKVGFVTLQDFYQNTPLVIRVFGHDYNFLTPLILGLFTATHKDKIFLPAMSALLVLITILTAPTNESPTSVSQIKATASPTPASAPVGPESAPATATVPPTATSAADIVSANAQVAGSGLIANWILVSEDGDTSYYIKSKSIEPGGRTTIFTLFDIRTAKSTNSGKSYSSLTNQDEYDCRNKKERLLNRTTAYSGNMGSGEIIVTNSDAVPNEWSNISPNTIEDVIFTIACSKKEM